MKKFDIFICHAGENKIDVVKPLIEGLSQKFTCWLDEEEILWGESLTQKVNHGLRDSKYVIVILSDPFVGKPWPEKELHSVLSKEARTGELIVLPLIVGDESIMKKIYEQYPLLEDKKFLFWDQGIEVISKQLEKLFNKNIDSTTSNKSASSKSKSEDNLINNTTNEIIFDNKRIEELFQTTPDRFEQKLKRIINIQIDKIDESQLNDKKLLDGMKSEFLLTPVELGDLIDKEKSEFLKPMRQYERTYQLRMYKCIFKYLYSGNGILFDLYHNKGGAYTISDYLYSRITIYDNFFELTVEIENDENYAKNLQNILNDIKGYLSMMLNKQKDFIIKFNASIEAIFNRTVEARKNKLEERIKKDQEFDNIS